MSNKRTIITIDGLASTGKSTIASSLAKKLKIAHLNSGILYRALGYICLNNPKFNEALLKEYLLKNDLNLRLSDDLEVLAYINNENITEKLFNLEISSKCNELAQFTYIRELLLDYQRNAFLGMDLVAEGRDMGTVIFPDAKYKFFIEVDLEEKISRRIKQLKEKSSYNSDLEQEVKDSIMLRDKRDSVRTLAAENAIIVDNSKSIEDAINFILSKIN